MFAYFLVKGTLNPKKGGGAKGYPFLDFRVVGYFFFFFKGTLTKGTKLGLPSLQEQAAQKALPRHDGRPSRVLPQGAKGL